LSSKELQALAQLGHDPIRSQIDAAISKALGLPNLAPIRELLAREPGLTAKDVSPRLKQTALDLGDDDPEDDDQQSLM
jgi:hypothetical protein